MGVSILVSLRGKGRPFRLTFNAVARPESIHMWLVRGNFPVSWPQDCFFLQKICDEIKHRWPVKSALAPPKLCLGASEGSCSEFFVVEGLNAGRKDCGRSQLTGEHRTLIQVKVWPAAFYYACFDLVDK